MVSIGINNKFYQVIKNMFILTIMVLTIGSIAGCDSNVVAEDSNVLEHALNDLEYQETEKELAGLTIYKYTSDQEQCPTWATKTLFETEDYRYVYGNHCPSAYFIFEDGEYIEIISYIKLRDITNQEVEESGIGRKIMK